MQLASARLLLLAASCRLAAAAELGAAIHGGHRGAPINSSMFDNVPTTGMVSMAAILLAGIVAAAFLLLDKWRRAAAATQQQQQQQQQQQAARVQQLPARHGLNPKPGAPQTLRSPCSPFVEVAARATSLQPPQSAPKTVSLQLSRSMPPAVSPFAASAAAKPVQASPFAAAPAQQLQPGQPSNATGPAVQPMQDGQHSPFAAATVQPLQPKPPSPFAGAAAAATSPFATAASALSKASSSTSTESQRVQQPLESGGAAGELARRPSPPHLSTMLDALPLFAAPPGRSRPTRGGAAGPSAPPLPAVPPGQRSRSPGGRHLLPHRQSPDRITLEQLRSEILGDDPLSGSEAQLESLLSTGLPAAGAAAAVRAGGGALDGAQQPAGGSPSASLPPSPGGAQDSDWEIAPNELEICKRPDGSLWQLGAGGFGRVYKAMRYGFTPVAVKVMAPTSDPTHSLYEDFKREARLLQRCMDPHIVSFLGASLNSDFTILVTEYCEGGSLSANLAAGKISWYRHGKQVALDVARGLVFLHCRGIVHFDLKSPNILLDRRGTAKIADLGLAKIMHHERSSVSGNLGTLNWAAPELLLGQPCNSSADIFSAGVLLWEICTGAVPVRGRMRPLAVPDDCPAEVAQLVEECMSPDPQARPTAQQLVERLLAAPGSPLHRAAPAGAAGGAARRGLARRSLEVARPAGQESAAAALARRRSDMGSRVGRAGSAGELASPLPSSPAAAAGRPPRPRSETNLPALAAQHALAAAHAAHAAQPALPAVEEDAEQPQQEEQGQRVAQTPSPRPTSPLPTALSVASDSALTGAMAPAGQVAAAVVAAQHMERGASLPVPQWGDAYGLGFC